MNPRARNGPDYFGLFLPLMGMAVMIYWLLS